MEARPDVLRRHIANGHELAFVTEGAARVVTAPQTFDLTPGKLLVIAPGVEHDEWPAEPPRPYTMIWCGTDATYARLDQTAYASSAGYRVGPNVALFGRTHVENIAAAIAAELAFHEWGWVRAVHGLLRYLCCILMRRLQRGRLIDTRPRESLTICPDEHTWQVIQAALRFCDLNFRHRMRLTDVSAAVGYSPNHLSRLISTHLGYPLSHYLRGLRINAAKNMLERSDLAISEIAYSAGYSDPGRFSRAFAQVTGVSPKAYREHLR